MTDTDMRESYRDILGPNPDSRVTALVRDLDAAFAAADPPQLRAAFPRDYLGRNTAGSRRRIGFIRWVVRPASALGVVALAGGIALASIHDLQFGLLGSSDKPSYQGRSDFGDPHWKTFPRFTPEMAVTVTVKDMPSGTSRSIPAYCYPPATYGHLGWRQGLIEAFDTRGFYEHLIMCAYSFKTERRARLAYRPLAQGLHRAISQREASPLNGGSIDNDSVGVQSLSMFGATYILGFRSQNAVVTLNYEGPATYPTARFLRLASTVTARLH